MAKNTALGISEINHDIMETRAAFALYYSRWADWLAKLDTHYIACYGYRWIRRGDGSLDPIGVTGIEVGVQWLRENRYLTFADFLDYEPTNLFAMVPGMRRLYEQRTIGGTQ